MNFQNKQVVITGGSTGIGLASAKAFINAGAQVLITGRSASKLHQAEKGINSPKLKIQVSDTADMNGINELEQTVKATGKKIDVLFLNAAIGNFSPIEQMKEADFDAQFSTNVKGPYFTLQRLIPHLADGGSVIFTSSVSASSAGLGTSVYAATKGALNKIAEVAANELAGRKIRVNIVSPGPIETPGLASVIPAEYVPDLAASTALQRLGQADEIARAVLFLASDDASFVSGSEFVIDGGYLPYSRK